MTKKQIEINNSINEFLQKSYALEKELEGMYPELTQEIRATSSKIAHFLILSNGIDEALRNFWNDKKGLVYERV